MRQAKRSPHVAVRKTDSFVVYRHLQETQHATAGKPMHTETGFLKLATDGTAVGSFAHPFPSGFVQEMSRGVWEKINEDDKNDTLQVTLQAKDFQRAVANPPANGKKQVHGFKRVYTLQGNDNLSYKQFLSTTEGGDNLYHHLSCSFTKK